MEFDIPEITSSVPELIRNSRQLREDLNENVARLRITLAQSKVVASEWSWRDRSATSPAAPPETKLLERLTKREIEVFRLIAEGKSTKQTAAVLGIAFRTAVCHRYRIFQKLHVHETASLVRLAVRAGLVQA